MRGAERVEVVESWTRLGWAELGRVGTAEKPPSVQQGGQRRRRRTAAARPRQDTTARPLLPVSSHAPRRRRASLPVQAAPHSLRPVRCQGATPAAAIFPPPATSLTTDSSRCASPSLPLQLGQIEANIRRVEEMLKECVCRPPFNPLPQVSPLTRSLARRLKPAAWRRRPRRAPRDGPVGLRLHLALACRAVSRAGAHRPVGALQSRARDPAPVPRRLRLPGAAGRRRAARREGVQRGRRRRPDRRGPPQLPQVVPVRDGQGVGCRGCVPGGPPSTSERSFFRARPSLTLLPCLRGRALRRRLLVHRPAPAARSRQRRHLHGCASPSSTAQGGLWPGD